MSLLIPGGFFVFFDFVAATFGGGGGTAGSDLLLELELFILTFGAIGGGGNLL